jgi:probable rRNA maturation factor
MTERVEVVVHADVDGDDAELVGDPQRWSALAQASLCTEGVIAGELNLMFIGVDAMTDLNVKHMAGTGPTDVLAFPLDGEDLDAIDGRNVPVEMPILLGDVVICPAVARTYAQQHGRTVDDELALLVVHGVLHVMGHDHADPEETSVMQSREQALLEAHHSPSPNQS